MLFDGRSTNQLTPQDIRSLIRDKVKESQFVDFKRQPYSGSDSGVREILKDVTAFANASGGYILIGVDETPDNRASSLWSVPEPERVRRSILDRCFVLIDPRLPELDISVVVVDGNSVVVCRVPESPKKPHAAVPDREHHYFWLRYEDGIKLMTVAEVREAVAGDAVHRELAELRRQMQSGNRQTVFAEERDRDVDEQGLLELRSPEAFILHAEKLFLKHTGNRPYLRLTATPPEVGQVDIREHREALFKLLEHPPKYRSSGWDMSAYGTQARPRQSAAGLQAGDHGFRHLRLYWNGHLEFWTPSDEETFSWGMDSSSPPAQRPFNPMAIIETSSSFVILAKRIWDTTGIAGEAAFQLMLSHVRGRRLPPHAHETYDRMFALTAMRDDPGIGTFQDAVLRVGPVKAAIAALPDAVAFQLVSEIYYRLGYVRKHIPYFDAEGRFVYDVSEARD